MKLIGAAMVFLGCVGMALRYIFCQGRRIRELEELLEIIESMEEEIRYSRAALPECFLRVGGERESEFGERFWQIGRKAVSCPQEELGKLLREGLGEKLRELLPLAEETLFYDFAAQHTFQEEGMQVRALGRVRKRIGDFTERLKAEHREKCRVALCLGTMGGLFLIVLLV